MLSTSLHSVLAQGEEGNDKMASILTEQACMILFCSCCCYIWKLVASFFSAQLRRQAHAYIGSGASVKVRIYRCSRPLIHYPRPLIHYPHPLTQSPRPLIQCPRPLMLDASYGTGVTHKRPAVHYCCQQVSGYARVQLA
jgi:hypothetical protein